MPGVPQPQTNLGTLEHTGLNVDELEIITDIPPSIDWMTSMNLYLGSFTYSVSSDMTKPLWARPVMASGAPSLGHLPPSWLKMPFTGAKFWNGLACFKFIAIKPPRVTGKLLVRYSFKTPSSLKDAAHDRLQRGIIKEWDLGQSSQFEFDISSATTVRASPTWVPSLEVLDRTYFSLPLAVHPSTWWKGMFEILPAQRLQPGGLFPDTIRILVFRCFKNFSAYVPTDFRGVGKHVLTTADFLLPCSEPSGFVNYDDTGTEKY